MTRKSQPKKLRIDTDAGTSRIWNGDGFRGTAVIYAVTQDDHTAFQCDFELETLHETYPTETRAYRESSRNRGKKVRPLARDRLCHEAVIIFGPEMLPNDAAAALRRLALRIETHGLLVGKDEKDRYVTEAIDGNLQAD
jgi:hypothetical protein